MLASLLVSNVAAWPSSVDHHAILRRDQALAAVSARAASEAGLVEARSSAAPTFPPVFSAKMLLEQLVDGQPAAGTGLLGEPLENFLVQYTSLKRSVQFTAYKFAYGPKEFIGTPLQFLNMTTYHGDGFLGIKLNGETLDAGVSYPTQWSDMWGWLKAARDGGSAVLDGYTLHRWTLSLPPVAGDAHFDLYVHADGTPYRFLQNATAGASKYYMNYTFLEWSSDDSLLPNAWHGVVETDYTSPKPCAPPADPTPVNLTMYIFHPKDAFNISGQDLGDATGDTFFVCVDAITNFASGIDHKYAWISEYNVQILPRYGQYQNCNDYPPKCLGAENFFVGHEAAQTLGVPIGGQCVSNPYVGEWWSLPVGGKCGGGAVPGDGSCTWSATRVKTIDSPCLFDTLGFVNACLKDGRAPFPDASKLLVKAFVDDAAQGGCPALQV